MSKSRGKCMQFFLLSCFLFAAFNCFSQEKRDPIREEQLLIRGQFNPVITEAVKISSTPQVTDTVGKEIKIKYSFLDRHLPLMYVPDTISAARIKSEAVPKLYRNYIRAGVGTYLTPLLQFHHGSNRSKDQLFEFHGSHFSSGSGIDKVNASQQVNEENTLPTVDRNSFSINSIGASGKTLAGRNVLWGALNHRRQRVNNYGYNTSHFFFSTEPRQVYNVLSAIAGLGNIAADTGKINYSGESGFYYLDNLTRGFFGAAGAPAKELNGSLQLNLNKKHLREFFNLSSAFQFFRNTAPADTSDNVLLSASPYVVSEGPKWRLKAGIRIAAQAGSDREGGFHFYPDAEFSFNVIDDIIIPFAGVSGGLERVSYKWAYEQNPFVNQNLDLRNTNEKIRVYGGLKGNLSRNLSYSSTVSYSNIDDQPFFINDTVDARAHTFMLVYDDVKRLAVHSELHYHLSEKVQLVAKSDYVHFLMDRQLLDWHVPAFSGSVGAVYSLKEKIIAKADIFFIGRRYAMDYFYRPESWAALGNPEVQGPHPVLLKPITDVNLGVEYRYTKRFSGFVNLNNLGFARFMTWYNYPMQRLSVLGGITYSF